jgi:hypothetical protein
MKFNFLPKDEKFQDIFARSSKNVVETAKEFKCFIKNWDFNVEKIHMYEQEGDIIRHELIDKLNHTFITQIDREDIYKLSGELDDIVDMMQASADRLVIYNLKQPKDDGLLHLAGIIEKSTVLIEKAIVDMHDTKKHRRVLDYTIEINHLENEGDTLVRKLLTKLFENCSTASPLETMIWKEVYEYLEDIIDKCEDVACTIESIVVKNY